MRDLLAQALHIGHRVVDLSLAVMGLSLAAVGRIGGLTAGARDLIGSGHHFEEGGGHHVHGFALA
ncbi:hypothetical protein D9M71_680310 [compost metagenome]